MAAYPTRSPGSHLAPGGTARDDAQAAGRADTRAVPVLRCARQSQFDQGEALEGGVVKETCFVVMAIGDQSYHGETVSAASLKDAYSNVIKEALSQARPGLEIVRSDEVSVPGTITTDILTRLMHSTFVVVDITYPNPNVFYEVGVRHACRPGTILIRDSEAPVKAPFDVSHQRYIEYHKTPAGIKALAAALRETFAWYELNSGEPDNQLLTLAKLIGFSFPQYGREAQDEAMDNLAELMSMMLTNPELLTVAASKDMPDEDKSQRILQTLASNPRQAKKMLKLLVGMGLRGK
jgi:hypothetical protein